MRALDTGSQTLLTSDHQKSLYSLILYAHIFYLNSNRDLLPRDLKVILFVNLYSFFMGFIIG